MDWQLHWTQQLLVIYFGYGFYLCYFKHVFQPPQVRYKGKKLDSYKNNWYRQKRLEFEREGEALGKYVCAHDKNISLSDYTLIWKVFCLPLQHIRITTFILIVLDMPASVFCVCVIVEQHELPILKPRANPLLMRVTYRRGGDDWQWQRWPSRAGNCWVWDDRQQTSKPVSCMNCMNLSDNQAYN